jgi:hypothetical protein
MGKITLEEIKEFLDVKGIRLEDENEYLRRRSFFNTCAEISNYKLNNLELMISNETMIDLITNQRPDLEYIDDRSQLIAIQYKYYDLLPETMGKLTKEEKTKLAFANFASVYILVFDFKSKKQKSILDNFKTVGEFESFYQDYKGRSQIMFSYLVESEDEKALGNIN